MGNKTSVLVITAAVQLSSGSNWVKNGNGLCLGASGNRLNYYNREESNVDRCKASCESIGAECQSITYWTTIRECDINIDFDTTRPAVLDGSWEFHNQGNERHPVMSTYSVPIPTECFTVVMCDVITDCSNRAFTVEFQREDKSCLCHCNYPFTGHSCSSCLDHWEGINCDYCPLKFNQETCSSCALNYITYPHCNKCSFDYCSNHALRVYSNSQHTKCLCDCQPAWKGSDRCATCTSNYFEQHGQCYPCTDTQCSGTDHGHTQQSGMLITM